MAALDDSSNTGHPRAMNAVLTINRGSSSLKFAAYAVHDGDVSDRQLLGAIQRIGRPNAVFSATNLRTGERFSETLDPRQHGDCVAYLTDWLTQHASLRDMGAIGHRVVHGGPRFYEPRRVDQPLLDELKKISDFDPEHLPAEIQLIEAIAARWPRVPQVACFDTAFHRSMPRVARILPIPRRFERLGVERYGFHGLSYAYLMEELARLAPRQAAGRIILAHLGAGASLAAVRGGHSIDTTMAFTPTAGMPMATRSGDLDPGLVAFLSRVEGMTSEQFNDMVNQHSGLAGVSETTGDMQELLAKQATDPRAAEAIALFCYQAKKWIGAYVAALGGLDTLVFSGGIGEHSPEIRRRVCTGLECFGIAIDETANDAGGTLISPLGSRVGVYVIPTDEELMIARSTAAVVAAG